MQASVEQVAVADERSNEGRFGFVVERLGRSGLKDSSATQDGNPVREHQGFRLVVSDEDEGGAKLVLEGFQLALHVAAQVWIKGCQGFIEQEHRRFTGQCPRQSDTLLLTAGKFLGVAIGNAFQSDERQQGFDALLDGRRCMAFAGKSERDVVIRIQVREQGVALKHRVDRAAVRRQVGDFLSSQVNLPGIRCRQSGNQPQQGRLATSRRTEKGQKLTGFDPQRNLRERQVCAITLGKRKSLDGRQHRRTQK